MFEIVKVTTDMHHRSEQVLADNLTLEVATMLEIILDSIFDEIMYVSADSERSITIIKRNSSN